jgi:hypothetical protein
MTILGSKFKLNHGFFGEKMLKYVKSDRSLCGGMKMIKKTTCNSSDTVPLNSTNQLWTGEILLKENSPLLWIPTLDCRRRPNIKV